MSEERENAKKDFEEVAIKFGKGLMGEPFQGKDGNTYVEIKIPNVDQSDKSPWASFVAREKSVHENQFGKGMWIKLPAEGSTTIKKPTLVGQNEEGKNIYDDVKTKVPNKELKKMVESYKERSSLKDKMEQKKEQVAENKSSHQQELASKPKSKETSL